MNHLLSLLTTRTGILVGPQMPSSRCSALGSRCAGKNYSPFTGCELPSRFFTECGYGNIGEQIYTHTPGRDLVPLYTHGLVTLIYICRSMPERGMPRQATYFCTRIIIIMIYCLWWPVYYDSSTFATIRTWCDVVDIFLNEEVFFVCFSDNIIV